MFSNHQIYNTLNERSKTPRKFMHKASKTLTKLHCYEKENIINLYDKTSFSNCYKDMPSTLSSSPSYMENYSDKKALILNQIQRYNTYVYQNDHSLYGTISPRLDNSLTDRKFVNNTNNNNSRSCSPNTLSLQHTNHIKKLKSPNNSYGHISYTDRYALDQLNSFNLSNNHEQYFTEKHNRLNDQNPSPSLNPSEMDNPLSSTMLYKPIIHYRSLTPDHPTQKLIKSKGYNDITTTQEPNNKNYNNYNGMINKKQTHIRRISGLSPNIVNDPIILEILARSANNKTPLRDLTSKINMIGGGERGRDNHKKDIQKGKFVEESSNELLAQKKYLLKKLAQHHEQEPCLGSEPLNTIFSTNLGGLKPNKTVFMVQEEALGPDLSNREFGIPTFRNMALDELTLTDASIDTQNSMINHEKFPHFDQKARNIQYTDEESSSNIDTRKKFASHTHSNSSINIFSHSILSQSTNNESRLFPNDLLIPRKPYSDFNSNSSIPNSTNIFNNPSKTIERFHEHNTPNDINTMEMPAFGRLDLNKLSSVNTQERESTAETITLNEAEDSSIHIQKQELFSRDTFANLAMVEKRKKEDDQAVKEIMPMKDNDCGSSENGSQGDDGKDNDGKNTLREANETNESRSICSNIENQICGISNHSMQRDSEGNCGPNEEIRGSYNEDVLALNHEELANNKLHKEKAIITEESNFNTQEITNRSDSSCCSSSSGIFKARIQYKDRSYYEGEVKLGKREGYGTLRTKSGTRIYEGNWHDDQYYGKGIEYNHYNSSNYKSNYGNWSLIKESNLWLRYEGDFRENVWDGIGKLYFNNGEEYYGEFKANRLHGKGSYYTANGEIILGIWDNNKIVKKL